MCRGLTPKNKNIKANTLTVLKAMEVSVPFVPYGQKKTAWEAVADISRTNLDLRFVNGSLCETRYKQVRDEYKAAQAAARAATGIAEAPPTEQDQILENLIGRENAFLQKEEEEKARLAGMAAHENSRHAVALDVREAAVEAMPAGPRPNQPDQAEDPIEERAVPPEPANGITGKRRRRRQDNGEVMEMFKRATSLLEQVATKYLSRQ